MKNILNYIPSVFFPILLNFCLTLVYGNFLSIEIYGKYNIFITIINLVYTIIFSFINISLLRFYNEYKEKKEESRLVSTYIYTILILLIFSSSICIVINKDYFIYYTLSIASITFITFFSNFYRAKEAVLKFNMIKIIPQFLNFIFIIIVALTSFLTIGNILIFSNISSVLLAVVLLLIYFFKKEIKLVYDFNILKKTIRYGMPMIVINLLCQIISSSDRIFINYFIDENAVGIYSFGYRVAELIMINLTLVLILALYPKLIELYDNNRIKECRLLLEKNINIFFVILIPIMFILFLLSKDIINILFKQYKGVEYILNFVLIGTFLYSFTLYTNKAFELSKKTNQLIKVLILAAIVNIVFNLLLIPKFGIEGAIVSTIISYLIYILYSLYLSRKIFVYKINYSTFFLVVCLNIIIFIFFSVIKNCIISINIFYLILFGIAYLFCYSSILFIIYKIQKKG